MAWSIFGQLDWLTVRVKRLCCAVKELQEGSSNYKVYRATLSTSGGGDPVVTVLENTLGGNIVWTKNVLSTGSYEGTLVGAFTDVNKIHILYNNRVSDDGGPSLYDVYLTRGGNDVLFMTTWNSGAPQDDCISVSNPLSIEIKLYP